MADNDTPTGEKAPGTIGSRWSAPFRTVTRWKIEKQHSYRRMVLGDAEANRRLMAEYLEAIAELDE